MQLKFKLTNWSIGLFQEVASYIAYSLFLVTAGEEDDDEEE